MAHNIHIPWTFLSSHFKFQVTPRRNLGRANLYNRKQPTQGADLRHFCRVFARTIATHSAHERSKYPNPVIPPDADEIVLSQKTAEKISKTVLHYRNSNNKLGRRSTCVNSGTYTCPCQLCLPERQIGVWITDLSCKRTSCRDCCCGYGRNHTDLGELANTLLLYGEMETLLGIAAHPEVSLVTIWELPYFCDSSSFGIQDLMVCALTSYVFFNMVYLHPETWEAEARQKWVAEKRKHGMVIEEEEVDYRKMVSWEKVVSRCTGFKNYDVHTYPHRLFFGVSGADYDARSWNKPPFWGREFRMHPSLQTEKQKIAMREKYFPILEDVEIVLFYLRCKGLPTEIGLQILAHADFKPERRLPVANDPLHPKNGEELRKYLSWCWKILIWTDVLMTAEGRKISWVYEITDVIRELWGVDDRGCGLFRYIGYGEWEDEDIEEFRRGDVLGFKGRKAVFL